MLLVLFVSYIVKDHLNKEVLEIDHLKSNFKGNMIFSNVVCNLFLYNLF